MAEYQIKNFSGIDVLSIDPVKDKFILPNKKVYIFSDAMCDYCWTGGTVLENTGNEKEYYCILCENNLSRVKLKNDFLNPTGDIFTFLLPKSWSKAEIEEWYQEFKERRLAQEEVRQHILEHGK
ncbi:MAG: hypothetical protein P8048_02085 [Calditrichia bacterium]